MPRGLRPTFYQYISSLPDGGDVRGVPERFEAHVSGSRRPFPFADCVDAVPFLNCWYSMRPSCGCPSTPIFLGGDGEHGVRSRLLFDGAGGKLIEKVPARVKSLVLDRLQTVWPTVRKGRLWLRRGAETFLGQDDLLAVSLTSPPRSHWEVTANDINLAVVVMTRFW